MGMFDSLYDAHNVEWQTKAYRCVLAVFRVGDPMPDDVAFDTYQVEVLGGRDTGFTDSFATVRDGVLASVPDPRDEALPLVDYHGGAS
jgi:hypothetical protein